MSALDEAGRESEADVWEELWETDAARCCSCPSCNHYALDYDEHKDEPCLLQTIVERIIDARLALLADPDRRDQAGEGLREAVEALQRWWAVASEDYLSNAKNPISAGLGSAYSAASESLRLALKAHPPLAAADGSTQAGDA